MTLTQRVVSLLPSATEMLCMISGGREMLVGRSHECNFPRDLDHIPVVTGQLTTFTTAANVDKDVSAALASGDPLYLLDKDALISLKPSVILTQELCNVCSIDMPAVIRVASRIDPPPMIKSISPTNLEEVISTVEVIGNNIGLHTEGLRARNILEARVAAVDARVEGARKIGQRRPVIAFVEWPDPIYVGGHWTPQLIERAGGAHPLNPPKASEGGGAGLSFPVSPEVFAASDPDYIIISPCGLDLNTTRQEYGLLAATDWWQRLSAVRNGRVVLVDGDAYFNRPGPRLVDCLEWLAFILHNDPFDWPGRDFPCEWISAAQTAEMIKQR